jgi:hypothetical protein
VSGNRVKRKIFRPKRDEVGACRKIHEEELHDSYFSPDTMRMRGVIWEGQMSACSVFVEPEGKRPLGRPRPIWENNIKMDHRTTGKDLDWIHLTYCRDQWWAVMKTVMHIWVTHEMQGISYVAEQLLAIEEGLGSMEFVTHFPQFLHILPISLIIVPFITLKSKLLIASLNKSYDLVYC